MPNIYDFSTLQDLKTMEINPNGWINPLTIEYAIGNQWGPTCYWRVEGTTHTFVIPISRLDFISSGDYGKHFTEVLEGFQEKDYSQWRATKFAADWMREYEVEYRNFIL
jgi:hypothetical protein